VPLVQAGGNLPLIDEVFLELEDGEGGLHLLEEAEDGADYGLLVTQAGGLLRYRLGDRLRVCGRHRDTPLLEFIGRADAVSDLVGEKLGEAFVARHTRRAASAPTPSAPSCRCCQRWDGHVTACSPTIRIPNSRG
jgi:hypothetical protein